MLSLGCCGSGKLKGAKKLVTSLPIVFYVLDLSGGMGEETAGQKEIGLEEISCPPLRAVFRGLSHPGICWETGLRHLDWEAFDRISAGIFPLDSPLLASYAIFSEDYLNLNIRFGYHMAVVDSLCGPKEHENYISLRFKGGGAALEGKWLRARFMACVLEHNDFAVRAQRDLLEAQMRRARASELLSHLEMLGRLLGCTRLLDMSLRDEGMVEVLVTAFLRGDYRFGPMGQSS
jgi:pyruvate,water dikinase